MKVAKGVTVSPQSTSSTDDFEAGLFRLPGFGGAGLFLRSGVSTSLGLAGQTYPELVFDVCLCDPQRRVNYLARPGEAGFVLRWSAFLMHAASDFHPEVSLAAFQDKAMGLSVDVESSTDTSVFLLVRVVEDLSSDVAEFDGLGFETTRAALASAAVECRQLDDISRRGKPTDELDPFYSGE